MTPDTKVNSFLMFEGKAEEAMKFYVALFPESAILDLEIGGGDSAAGGRTLGRRRHFYANGRLRLQLMFAWVNDRYGVSWQLNLEET